MNLMEKIAQKLKEAMLARDEFATTTLRGLKSAIQYEEVAQGKRESGISNDEIEKVIAREVKKRSDAIELYNSAGDVERAQKEMTECEILTAFLPEPMTDDELVQIIEKTIKDNSFTSKDIGRVIGTVKKEVGTRGDGAKIAGLVKDMLG